MSVVTDVLAAPCYKISKRDPQFDRKAQYGKDPQSFPYCAFLSNRLLS